RHGLSRMPLCFLHVAAEKLDPCEPDARALALHPLAESLGQLQRLGKRVARARQVSLRELEGSAEIPEEGEVVLRREQSESERHLGVSGSGLPRPPLRRERYRLSEQGQRLAVLTAHLFCGLSRALIVDGGHGEIAAEEPATREDVLREPDPSTTPHI